MRIYGGHTAISSLMIILPSSWNLAQWCIALEPYENHMHLLECHIMFGLLTNSCSSVNGVKQTNKKQSGQSISISIPASTAEWGSCYFLETLHISTSLWSHECWRIKCQKWEHSSICRLFLMSVPSSSWTCLWYVINIRLITNIGEWHGSCHTEIISVQLLQYHNKCPITTAVLSKMLSDLPTHGPSDMAGAR